MKKIFIILLPAFTFLSFKVFSQQLARATDVQMVSTSGTKIVITGGITFLGTSNWVDSGQTYLYKNTASSPEGWLDSTTTGVMNVASTGNVFFNGNYLQSFYGPTRFYDLTIRNSIGDTLLSSCEVRNNLNLDTGFVFTASGYGKDSLLVSNPATNAISSSSNFTKSWVNGRLSRIGNITSPVYLFPIGKTDSLYAPIKFLKYNTNPATWTAEYFVGLPFDYLNVSSPPINHISSVEYWEITSNTSGQDDDAKLSLSWRGQSRVSATASIRDSLLVAQYLNLPPFIWDGPGGWATGNTVGTDSLSGYVTTNTYNMAFDSAERRFTLGTFSKYNALPIKLLFFTATGDGNKVRLNWDVENEQDTKFYQIEKSINTNNFSILTTVNSLQLAQATYNGYDYTPVMGWNYYRLKIIDILGNYTYSPVRAVKFNNGLETVNIFPNPATDIINIQLPSSYAGNTILQLFQIDGKIISSIKPTTNNIQLNVLSLPSGTFILQIIKNDGSKESYRFVKQ